MKASDRLKVHRTDQIYHYPRRIYRRHTRYNPYLLITSTLEQQQQQQKTENSIQDDSMNNSSEHINGEISLETISNLTDEQVVIPTEHLQASKTTIKQRITSSNNHCSNCQQKFKTKSQFQSHLSRCQADVELRYIGLGEREKQIFRNEVCYLVNLPALVDIIRKMNHY